MAVDYQLAGLRALITGGSHGRGLAIADALARQGCHVAICSRSAEHLAEAERQLGQYGIDVLALAADVLKAESIASVTDEIDRAWGGVDILVNNVGGGGRG